MFLQGLRFMTAEVNQTRSLGFAEQIGRYMLNFGAIEWIPEANSFPQYPFRPPRRGRRTHPPFDLR
jgi:hypothetical protein